MGGTRKRRSGQAGRLYVGTAGWSYGGWGRVFYPEKVRTSYERLTFYATSFNAVEVNYSFYHLPKPETCAKWAESVPKHFLFAVKASRFITHVKRLETVEEAWQKFLAGVRGLGDRLGPVLFQFPSSFQADLDRLERFLNIVKRDRKMPRVRPVFEFRHHSWFTKATYDVLCEAGATLCIAHSSRYPYVEHVTADLVYYRFHGPKELFASKYGDEQLRSWATQMRQHLNSGKTVHAYFNNDMHGYAVENARTLQKMVGRVKGGEG